LLLFYLGNKTWRWDWIYFIVGNILITAFLLRDIEIYEPIIEISLFGP